ncbi:MAG: Fpg/Nei family DNA glycosylase [Thermoleophilia bacterium]|nr:Fpg/Nei family DNA glycosylase [Thermoleophilia bacterium]
MPEGHTIHRAATEHRGLLAGREVEVRSPQGRFADGARLLDGRRLDDVEAHGKHLFYRWDTGDIVHVHLGLFGKFRRHEGTPPEPRPTTRLRMAVPAGAIDLTGPTACALMDEGGRERILTRLGPDPLRDDADPERFVRRVLRSRAPVGTLLMDQSVIAGVGNVYRAESLFARGIHPSREGRDLTEDEARALWDTVREMLRDGVRRGRIITTSPHELGIPRSRMRRGDRTYVYRQDACRRCGGPVERWTVAGRNAFACPACQPGR